MSVAGTTAERWAMLKAQVEAEELTLEEALEQAEQAGAESNQRPVTIVANAIKRTIMVCGLQRMPYTFYPDQARRMLAEGVPKLQAFLDDYEEYLPSKGCVGKTIPKSLIRDENHRDRPFKFCKAKDED